MSEVKYKEREKFNKYGRCESDRKRVGDEAIYASPQKNSYKDYVNEIFAGLMWLG